MEYPKIYLAADNCLTSKRWTRPAEWMKLFGEVGIHYVEASADNECDPLYTTPQYIEDWINEIKVNSTRTGVRVVNLYSGHGTYATLGLAHTDKRIRLHMLNNWLKILLKNAKMLEAGIGFFCHAFSDSTLQDSILYAKAENLLYADLAELAISAGDYEGYLGVEQMYTPHQIPWTIQGARKLIKRVYQLGQKPLYITIDTGHQSGQHKFLRPDYTKIKDYINVYKKMDRINNLWLGPQSAYDIFNKLINDPSISEDKSIVEIQNEMDKYPYLFSGIVDGDTYEWLKQLGCYSPIIHLQQTTGNISSHQPFTSEYNENGIICADKVLGAIKSSYQQNMDEGMPPKCKSIYLTLEIFAGTDEMNVDITYKLMESVRYWRRFIPVDGMQLDELLVNFI